MRALEHPAWQADSDPQRAHIRDRAECLVVHRSVGIPNPRRNQLPPAIAITQPCMSDVPPSVRANLAQSSSERIVNSRRLTRSDSNSLQQLHRRRFSEPGRFDQLTLSHVLDLRHEVVRRTLVIPYERHRKIDPHLMSVGVQIPLLHRITEDLTLEHSIHLLEIGLEIVGMRNVLKSSLQKFVGGITGDRTKRRIHL